MSRLRFAQALAATAVTAAALLGSVAAATAQGPAPTALAPNTLTVVGTASLEPQPRDRNDNASIRKSVQDARAIVGPRALGDGRARAANLATSAGLKLGALLAIAEGQSPFAFPFPGPFSEDGTFGPGRYCGTVRRSTFKRDASGARRRTGSRAVKVCRVPRVVSAAYTMTFAASAV